MGTGELFELCRVLMYVGTVELSELGVLAFCAKYRELSTPSPVQGGA